MDSEAIDYKALYEQVRTELEDFKLHTWTAQQRRYLYPLIELVKARIQDMTMVEWVAVFVLLSIGLHYHQFLIQMKKAKS